MNPRISAGAVALAAAIALAGCQSMTDLQAQSLAQWKAFCASKHKQFVWQDTEKEEGIFSRSARVEGHCVGPGDKGYEPPAPPDAQQ